MLKNIIMYLIAVNLLAFISFGVDKQKARTNQWRITEKTLLRRFSGSNLWYASVSPQNTPSKIHSGAPHHPDYSGHCSSNLIYRVLKGGMDLCTVQHLETF